MISSVTGLVTTAALNTEATKIQNKIPDTTNVNTKATEIQSKIIDIT